MRNLWMASFLVSFASIGHAGSGAQGPFVSVGDEPTFIDVVFQELGCRPTGPEEGCPGFKFIEDNLIEATLFGGDLVEEYTVKKRVLSSEVVELKLINRVSRKVHVLVWIPSADRVVDIKYGTVFASSGDLTVGRP